MFINLGSVDNFTRGDLLGYICNTSKINGRGVGKIDVKGVYSFFEVPNADAQQVIDAFKEANFQGREVRIELSGAAEGGESRSPRSSGSGYPRREGGSGGRERREGGRERSYSGGASSGGFRDFSGKSREDRGERRRRF